MVQTALVLIAASALAADQDPDYDKLLNAAKFTLAESVDLAAKEAKEGTPLIALLDEGVRGQRFTVFFAKGDKSYGYSLNSSTGKLDSASRMSVDETTLVRSLNVTLKDAIGAALQREKGKAVEARFRMNGSNKPECMVRIFNDGKIRSVTVDGETGKVAGAKDGK